MVPSGVDRNQKLEVISMSDGSVTPKKTNVMVLGTAGFQKIATPHSVFATYNNNILNRFSQLDQQKLPLQG